MVKSAEGMMKAAEKADLLISRMGVEECREEEGEDENEECFWRVNVLIHKIRSEKRRGDPR
jgi:hypothetical protein